MTSEVPATIWGWSTADTRNELGRRACDLHFPVLMPQGERVTEFSHSASEIQALVHKFWMEKPEAMQPLSSINTNPEDGSPEANAQPEWMNNRDGLWAPWDWMHWDLSWSVTHIPQEKHGAMDGICSACESQVCHDTATVPKQQDFAFPQPSCHFAPRPPGSTGACSCKWNWWLLFGILINE